MKFPTYYSSISIKYKILGFFWLVVLLIAGSLGTYSYTISKNSVVDRAYVSNYETAQQINSSIQFAQNDFYDILTLVGIDTNVQELLTEAQTITQSQLENYASWESQRLSSLQTIINLILSKRYVSRIALYSSALELPVSFIDKNGSIETKEAKSFSQLAQSDEYTQIIAANGRVVWFAREPGTTFFNVQSQDRQIVAARLIKNLNTQKPIGILLAASDEELFRTIYSPQLQNDEASITILDPQGRLISSGGVPFFESIADDTQLIGNLISEQTNRLVEIPAGTRLVTSFSDNDAGWTIIYTISYDHVLGEITNIKWFTIALIVLSFLLSIPITMLIFRPVTHAISQLLTAMERFQSGKFDTYIETHHRDELGKLATGYNEMAKSLKTLIDKVYIANLKEKEAELKALEAQINPHFLYNTLETMMTKAETQKNFEIAQMVNSLARFFRLSLNRGNSKTTVANEKELIEHYLLLQKTRFKDRLQYSISMDEEILDISIPKLILEPFVENAIIHGLSQKKDGGSISVRGYRESGNIIFEVKDTGVGMSEDRYKELIYNLNHNIEYTTTRGGYALHNVNERLKLAYGEQGYKLDISSLVMQGYFVRISIFNIFEGTAHD